MRRRTLSAGLAATALAVLAVVQPAVAKPVYPSQHDVNQAKQHVRTVAGQVKAAQAAVAGAQKVSDAADSAAETAAENYDQAVIELDTAQRASDAAAAAAQKARQKLATAQAAVGQLASQQYQQGGPIADLEVLFSPSGPQSVLDQASMIQTLAAQRNHTVDQLDSARVVANALGRQAQQALTQQKAATAKMQQAKAAAQAQAAAAEAAVTAQQNAENHLTVELAAAQRTSVKVEKERQAGLARAAAERAAAAAAARAARESHHMGSSAVPSGGGASSGSAAGGEIAVAWARQKVGLPYLWGGDGPGSYDCSGLTMKAWAQAGVSLPHSSAYQYQDVEHISYGSMRPGDLIFYALNPSSPMTIHHVTMYIGGGMMIEAPHTGAWVRITPVRWGDGAMPYAGRP